MLYMNYIGVLNVLYRSHLIVTNSISNDRSYLIVNLLIKVSKKP